MTTAMAARGAAAAAVAAASAPATSPQATTRAEGASPAVVVKGEFPLHALLLSLTIPA